MSGNDQDVQSDCRLFGNERQQETLVSAAQGRRCRCSRHRHNMACDSFEATFGIIPTQVRFTIPWQGSR
jgi:hypothetical protein